MATSSFSKKFVIDNPKEVEKLIEAMENPIKVYIQPELSSEEEAKEKEALICAIKKRLACLN